MPPKSKFTPRPNRLQANRVFTNRDRPIACFNAARHDLGSGQHSILTFYGIGGEGKTALCAKFRSILAAEQPRQAVWGHVDFYEERHRSADRALLQLRRSFRASGKIAFPAFEVAITQYWEKIYPEANIRDLLKDVLDDQEDMLSSLADNARDWAELGEELPAGIGLGIKALNYLRRKAKESWAKRANEALYGLELLESHQLLEKLPYIFAADLLAYAEKDGHLVPVVFFDTYEALWEKREQKGGLGATEVDGWLRELVAAAPGVLFVICGRDRLDWDKDYPDDWQGCLDNQHLLGGLSAADADEFLRQIPVADPALRQAMIRGAQGSTEGRGAHPYYLDLAVDLYLDWLDDGKTPSAEDFGKTPRELVDRFLRYRSPAEIETLKALSLPRSFDAALFNDLVERFKTGYPLTAFAEFTAYSFVQVGADGRYRLHALMRDSLRGWLGPETREAIRAFLFQRYDSRLPDNPRAVGAEHDHALQEAVYHADWENTEAGLAWFFGRAKVFHDAAHFGVLISLYPDICEQAERRLGGDHPDVATGLNNLAGLFHTQGRYAEAEPLFRRSLGILEQALGVDHPDVAASLNNLAVLLHAQGRYAEAEPLYRRSLGILEQALGVDHPDVAASLNNLAELYRTQGRYAEAEPLYRRSLGIWEQAPGGDHPDVATGLNGLATLFCVQGRYTEAEPLCHRSLAIREQALGGEHPGVATSLNNLAGLFHAQGRYAEAEPLCRRCLDIREKALGGDHPDVALSLNNLAVLYHCQGRYAEAEPLCRRCLEIREKNLGAGHPDTVKARQLLEQIQAKLAAP